MPGQIYLISACLCGQACRYDAQAATVNELALLQECGLALAICPELEGGLAVPRPPCEISNDRVLSRDGTDYTSAYRAGAEKTLELARQYGINRAIFKERSPTCGSSLIYDGSFTGKRIAGQGITTALLRQNGIVVASEFDYRDVFGAIL